VLGFLRKKKSQELWDSEYEQGRWDYLQQQSRFNNSTFIANYLNSQIGDGDDKILDVGAGNGSLFPMLELQDAGNYVPTDISKVALEELVEKHSISNSWVADIEKVDLTDTDYEYIVLNEVVYYFKHPINTVNRCISAAKKNCIVSMYHSPRTNIIRLFMPKPSFSVRVNAEYKWTIMFYLK
jgi:2-polyprenyl-3-methyl-5-hydroxy-6-metoxy-1,4-benzoquinol methylase